MSYQGEHNMLLIYNLSGHDLCSLCKEYSCHTNPNKIDLASITIMKQFGHLYVVTRNRIQTLRHLTVSLTAC